MSEKSETAHEPRKGKRTNLGLASPDRPIFQGPIVIHSQLLPRKQERTKEDSQEQNGNETDLDQA